MKAGGNAVDAAVAAAFVTFIAEYTVSATGGGALLGNLVSWPVNVPPGAGGAVPRPAGRVCL